MEVGVQNKNQMKKANIITILLIIVGLVLAGAVVWFMTVGKTALQGQSPSPSTEEAGSSGEFAPLTTNNDPASLETDLNNTKVDSLDSDLGSIGADLSSI